MADFNLNTREVSVLHEFVELRLGVTTVAVLPEIGRFASVPCDDFERIGIVDPNRQHFPAGYSGTAVQRGKFAGADAERWGDPGGHDDDATRRPWRATPQRLVEHQ